MKENGEQILQKEEYFPNEREADPKSVLFKNQFKPPK